MDAQSFARRFLTSTRTLITNGYFWGGLVVLGLIAAGLFALFNFAVMPAYTRHDDTVVVPDVTRMPISDARATLREHGLNADTPADIQRFNPDLPRDVVVAQNPTPEARVKPGRRIYLTVNSGRQIKVRVPPLRDLSLREAKNRLVALGLRVDNERPDSVPSPYPGTITRQEPEAGDSLAEGAGVTLWYSTGLGTRYVTVPDVMGLTVAEAERRLLTEKLRAVAVGFVGTDEEDDATVNRQGREPGTRVREGSEIRLFLGELEEAAPDE